VVPQAVVDLLEAVEVEEEQQRPVWLHGAQRLRQRAAIGESRERVAVGEARRSACAASRSSFACRSSRCSFSETAITQPSASSHSTPPSSEECAERNAPARSTVPGSSRPTGRSIVA
jgi:hypothetical protein